MVKNEVFHQSKDQTESFKCHQYGTRFEASQCYFYNPDTEIAKYRSKEPCAEHPYKYFLDPRSPAGISYKQQSINIQKNKPRRTEDLADDTATITGLLTKSNRWSDPDTNPAKSLSQAASLLVDHVRGFTEGLKATVAINGTISAPNVAYNKYRSHNKSSTDDASDGDMNSDFLKLSTLPHNMRKLPSGKADGLPERSEIADALRQLNLKYPNDKLELVFENDEPRFKCHDCIEQLYKVSSSSNNFIQNIKVHVESATHGYRIEVRLARTSEKPVVNSHVEARRNKVLNMKKKYPDSSKYADWPKTLQGSVPTNIPSTEAPTSKNVVSKEETLIGPLATSSHSTNFSKRSQSQELGVSSSEKRPYAGIEGPVSSEKRARLVRTQGSASHSASVLRQIDSSSDEAQPGDDDLDDMASLLQRELPNSSRDRQTQALVRKLKIEQSIQEETINTFSSELRKQRKIAAAQQEVLEHLVKENKKHSELLKSGRESLNATNQEMSTLQDNHESEIARLKERINRLQNYRNDARTVAGQHAVDLADIRKRLKTLESRELDAEDDVQSRAFQLRDQINGEQ